MRELQEFTKIYQKELNYHIKDDSYPRSKESLLMNQMLLTTEVSEVSELLRELFTLTEKNLQEGYGELEAFSIAKKQISNELGKEISDCLAYLIKLSNFFERDIEKDFYNKMEEVRMRVQAK
ncbi:hypothetical protein [Bacillus sp. V33-4]|uniref:hypothetical protein n=1 Tax=Bacillus sp. V33-4 TaxID=2054169 RepID=UPI000C784F9D|nr:hypothetical protein [Bacillus sp. V33-4]PLR85739.1 hypothetical protein CVD23_08010 [Bacillus sp. V33-4]